MFEINICISCNPHLTMKMPLYNFCSITIPSYLCFTLQKYMHKMTTQKKKKNGLNRKIFLRQKRVVNELVNNKTFLYIQLYDAGSVFSYNNNVPLNITILILPLFRAQTTIILHQLYAKTLRSSGVVYAYQISFVLFGVFFKETFIYLLCLVVFYLICKKCLSRRKSKSST